MGSTFGGIELGKRALQTQQKSLNVTGHNISNANNEGYSRQRAIQTSTRPHTVPNMNNPVGAGQIGTGVTLERIERVRDEFIDTRLRYENHFKGEWQTKRDGLQEIEAIFNELDEGGLVDSLNQFWDSFQELNNNPESIAVRSAVIQKSVNLTTQFNHLDKEMQDLRRQVGEDIGAKVTKLNYYTEKIADLNSQISAIQADESKAANDLMDKRDLIIDKLSNLADIQVRKDDLNQTNISLNGVSLVHADKAQEVAVTKSGDNRTISVDTDDDLTDDDNYTYKFDKYGFEVDGNKVDIKSGEIRGLMDVRDKLKDYKVNKLDKLARKLKNKVNNIHKDGYGLDRSTGLDFFKFEGTEYDAGHLKVSKTIEDNPAKIAAAKKDADVDGDGKNDYAGDGSNALEIANLQYAPDSIDSTDFNDFWESEISQLGIDIDRADQMSNNKEVLTDNLKQQREEKSGVSLDEEMTKMVKYQHGYSAAAKFTSKVDEMLNTLINGIVR